MRSDAMSITKIMPTISNRRALYAALFLHDIAKGRIEDHSIAGARIARKLCPRLGLSEAQTETAACADEIADAARTRWFAVAGLTAGSTQMIDSLSETIALIRKRSQNPHIGIMVGGPLFAEDPSLVAAVGADATAPSAPTAVLVAQKLSDAASAHLN